MTKTGQEKKDTLAVVPKPSFAGFVTNGFGDNYLYSVSELSSRAADTPVSMRFWRKNPGRICPCMLTL